MQLEIWQLILGFVASLLSGAAIKNLAEFIIRIKRERREDAKENWALEKDRFAVINEHKDQIIRDLRRELKEKKRREIKKSLTEIDGEIEDFDR